LFGPAGAAFKVHLSKEFRECKEKCMKTESKDICVEKCRHQYYLKIEKKRDEIKKIKSK